ncbi:hypothetical protein AB0E83_05570 [Streptomyces sp. NPDC035033]|uniref:hypothetical protein n=1 Tax=Streptomyces sp. NPDC035033 TaxID=3155368 RepID=UPI003402D0B8
MDTDENMPLRAALERTAEDLPPLPDLVPLAVREGRRRRARARFAVVTAALGAVTAGALGLTLLPGAGPAPSAPAAPPADGPGFEERVAALLDEVLPAEVTDVRPVDIAGGSYMLDANGTTFRMTVAVPTADSATLPQCENAPAGSSLCDREELRLGPVSELGGRVRVGFLYRGKSVTITVYDWPGEAKVPVEAADLMALGREPRFLELVRERVSAGAQRAR